MFFFALVVVLLMFGVGAVFCLVLVSVSFVVLLVDAVRVGVVLNPRFVDRFIGIRVF